MMMPLATVNAMDFLLRWNFHHFNNPITKKELGKLSEKMDMSVL